jgi:hypothetical protein
MRLWLHCATGDWTGTRLSLSLSLACRGVSMHTDATLCSQARFCKVLQALCNVVPKARLYEGKQLWLQLFSKL